MTFHSRMRTYLFITMLVLVSLFGFAQLASASTIAEHVSGRIVLQVQQHGEAWYVYPGDLHRYYLGRASDAFSIIKSLGLGITEENLAKIPVSGSTAKGDTALRNRLSGYVLLQVQQHGEAWYVNPVDTHRYSLGRTDDAFALMRNLGLGISNTDLATIPIGNISEGGATSGIHSVLQTVVTSRGTFSVDSLFFDRRGTNIKVMTDTGNGSNCATNCAAFPLGTYVTRRGATAGIHGTYFCPQDYASCANSINFYFYPVYNSFNKVMINDDRIKYTTEPLVAFDTANKPYYFHNATSFQSVQAFETAYSVTLRSAISNGPSLVEGGKNILDASKLDSKQATVKSYRGAIGWKGDTIFLLVVRSATVTDSAAVVTAMGMDYAMNLDGGGSTALYNGGKYILGPGRNLPNAIVVTK